MCLKVVGYLLQIFRLKPTNQNELEQMGIGYYPKIKEIVTGIASSVICGPLFGDHSMVSSNDPQIASTLMFKYHASK